jgi:hypothetical protein
MAASLFARADRFIGWALEISGVKGWLHGAVLTNSSGTEVGNVTTPLVVNSSAKAGGLEYETVAASQTAQTLGPTGALGDYLSHIVIVPGTTSPGNVIILDNATTIYTFAGGAGSTADLRSFTVPVGALSVSGAWKITTGANVTVLGVGDFT